MKNRKRKLILEQIDRKLKPFAGLAELVVPPEGWVYSIRKALNMSLRQLGKKLGISPQAVRDLEESEKKGTITLKSLQDIARSMEMQFLYVLVPNDGSLEELVNKRAMEIARQIVNRTSHSMTLEDQENPKERILRALEEKKNELKSEMPKFLWD